MSDERSMFSSFPNEEGSEKKDDQKNIPKLKQQLEQPVEQKKSKGIEISDEDIKVIVPILNEKFKEEYSKIDDKIWEIKEKVEGDVLIRNVDVVGMKEKEAEQIKTLINLREDLVFKKQSVISRDNLSAVLNVLNEKTTEMEREKRGMSRKMIKTGKASSSEIKEFSVKEEELRSLNKIKNDLQKKLDETQKIEATGPGTIEPGTTGTEKLEEKRTIPDSKAKEEELGDQFEVLTKVEAAIKSQKKARELQGVEGFMIDGEEYLNALNKIKKEPKKAEIPEEGMGMNEFPKKVGVGESSEKEPVGLKISNNDKEIIGLAIVEKAEQKKIDFYRKRLKSIPGVYIDEDASDEYIIKKVELLESKVFQYSEEDVKNYLNEHEELADLKWAIEQRGVIPENNLFEILDLLGEKEKRIERELTELEGEALRAKEQELEELKEVIGKTKEQQISQKQEEATEKFTTKQKVSALLGVPEEKLEKEVGLEKIENLKEVLEKIEEDRGVMLVLLELKRIEGGKEILLELELKDVDLIKNIIQKKGGLSEKVSLEEIDEIARVFKKKKEEEEKEKLKQLEQLERLKEIKEVFGENRNNYLFKIYKKLSNKDLVGLPRATNNKEFIEQINGDKKKLLMRALVEKENSFSENVKSLFFKKDKSVLAFNRIFRKLEQLENFNDLERDEKRYLLYLFNQEGSREAQQIIAKSIIGESELKNKISKRKEQGLSEKKAEQLVFEEISAIFNKEEAKEIKKGIEVNEQQELMMLALEGNEDSMQEMQERSANVGVESEHINDAAKVIKERSDILNRGKLADFGIDSDEFLRTFNKLREGKLKGVTDPYKRMKIVNEELRKSPLRKFFEYEGPEGAKNAAYAGVLSIALFSTLLDEIFKWLKTTAMSVDGKSLKP